MNRRLLVVVSALIVLAPRLALAQPLQPHDLASKWTWDFSTLLCMEIGGFAYAFGVFRLWQRAGRGHGVGGWQVVAFAGGMAALVLALISPLDALSDVLFSAHMGQHMVLIMIAAPLFALSGAPVALLWALPRSWARGIGRERHLRGLGSLLTQPPVAWTLAVVTLWTWHLPALYQAALQSTFVHAIEHASFLLTATLFWWILVHLVRQQGTRCGIGVIYLFTAAIQSSALGALMTFASQPWYPSYGASEIAWGLSPLDDQRLAGLIMWVPGGVIYTLVAAGLFVVWLNALDRKMQRASAS